MSDPVSGSNNSSLLWKLTSVIFIVLTVGASATAYYYYVQNQNNLSDSRSRAADRDLYYSQWQSDESKISTLNQQVSSDNNQILSDKTTISNDQKQIAQLQSELYNPACQPNCDSMIAQLHSEIDSLNAQVTSLNSQIAIDNNQIAADSTLILSLNNQISNLQDILGIRKSQVIASGVTKNEPQCGGSGNPVCQGSSACTNPANCIPQDILPSDFFSFCSPNCYQGVLVLSWTSTILMKISFSSSYQGSTAVSMSSSSTGSGDFAFPIVANFSSTGSLSTNGFHNDSCHSVGFGNFACDAVSLTYSETFYY